MRIAGLLVLGAIVLAVAEILTEQPWWARMIATVKRRARELGQ